MFYLLNAFDNEISHSLTRGILDTVDIVSSLIQSDSFLCATNLTQPPCNQMKPETV